MAQGSGTRQGSGPDITDNSNSDMAPKPGATRSNTGPVADKGGKGGAARNPDGTSQNRGPGTTRTVGEDTGQG